MMEDAGPLDEWLHQKLINSGGVTATWETYWNQYTINSNHADLFSQFKIHILPKDLKKIEKAAKRKNKLGSEQYKLKFMEEVKKAEQEQKIMSQTSYETRSQSIAITADELQSMKFLPATPAASNSISISPQEMRAAIFSSQVEAVDLHRIFRNTQIQEYVHDYEEVRKAFSEEGYWKSLEKLAVIFEKLKVNFPNIKPGEVQADDLIKAVHEILDSAGLKYIDFVMIGEYKKHNEIWIHQYGAYAAPLEGALETKKNEVISKVLPKGVLNKKELLDYLAEQKDGLYKLYFLEEILKKITNPKNIRIIQKIYLDIVKEYKHDPLVKNFVDKRLLAKFAQEKNPVKKEAIYLKDIRKIPMEAVLEFIKDNLTFAEAFFNNLNFKFKFANIDKTNYLQVMIKNRPDLRNSIAKSGVMETQWRNKIELVLFAQLKKEIREILVAKTGVVLQKLFNSPALQEDLLSYFTAKNMKWLHEALIEKSSPEFRAALLKSGMLKKLADNNMYKEAFIESLEQRIKQDSLVTPAVELAEKPVSVSTEPELSGTELENEKFYEQLDEIVNPAVIAVDKRKTAEATEDIEAMKESPYPRALIKLLKKNADPFTVSKGNSLLKVNAAYRLARGTHIKNIVDLIIQHPESANAFFKRRLGTKRLWRGRNFREELCRDPKQIDRLIKSGSEEIKQAIREEELLDSSHLIDDRWKLYLRIMLNPENARMILSEDPNNLVRLTVNNSDFLPGLAVLMRDPDFRDAIREAGQKVSIKDDTQDSYHRQDIREMERIGLESLMSGDVYKIKNTELRDLLYKAIRRDLMSYPYQEDRDYFRGKIANVKSYDEFKELLSDEKVHEAFKLSFAALKQEDIENALKPELAQELIADLEKLPAVQPDSLASDMEALKEMTRRPQEIHEEMSAQTVLDKDVLAAADELNQTVSAKPAASKRTIEDEADDFLAQLNAGETESSRLECRAELSKVSALGLKDYLLIKFDDKKDLTHYPSEDSTQDFVSRIDKVSNYKEFMEVITDDAVDVGFARLFVDVKKEEIEKCFKLKEEVDVNKKDDSDRSEANVQPMAHFVHK